MLREASYALSFFGKREVARCRPASHRRRSPPRTTVRRSAAVSGSWLRAPCRGCAGRDRRGGLFDARATRPGKPVPVRPPCPTPGAFAGAAYPSFARPGLGRERQVIRRQSSCARTHGVADSAGTDQHADPRRLLNEIVRQAATMSAHDTLNARHTRRASSAKMCRWKVFRRRRGRRDLYAAQTRLYADDHAGRRQGGQAVRVDTASGRFGRRPGCGHLSARPGTPRCWRTRNCRRSSRPWASPGRNVVKADGRPRKSPRNWPHFDGHRAVRGRPAIEASIRANGESPPLLGGLIGGTPTSGTLTEFH